MDDDDYPLTPEEIALYREATLARVDAIKARALKRLAMTDEERALFRIRGQLRKDPAFRRLFTGLLIAVSKNPAP